MKIALSMWSVHKYYFDKTWNVVDFIKFAAKTKATGVELLSIFWRDKEQELPLVEDALQRTGLKVACYAACNNFVSRDPEVRQAQLKEVTDAIDMAVHFGAKVVRVFSGDVHKEIPFEEGYGYVIEGLQAAAAYAEAKGVILCLENHGQFAGKSDQVLDIIHKIGSLSLRSTFDTGNFLLVGQNPSDAVLELKDYIKHVHMKDFVQVDEAGPNVLKSLDGSLYLGKIAGEGQVDLPFIVSQLVNSDFDGWYTVEFEGREEQKEGSIKAINNTYELLKGVQV